MMLDNHGTQIFAQQADDRRRRGIGIPGRYTEVSIDKRFCILKPESYFFSEFMRYINVHVTYWPLQYFLAINLVLSNRRSLTAASAEPREDKLIQKRIDNDNKSFRFRTKREDYLIIKSINYGGN